ncbi:hypothetical protein [Kineococcus sp. SYSU DK005]|uniref:hypothetical protein n=1 Tax=Kineococcus sp. SYSU DK005 TaxID=3383126 RepID=UPI003D7D5242
MLLVDTLDAQATALVVAGDDQQRIGVLRGAVAGALHHSARRHAGARPSSRPLGCGQGADPATTSAPRTSESVGEAHLASESIRSEKVKLIATSRTVSPSTTDFTLSKDK